MQKLALLFPGQGSQYVGMLKGLHDQYAVARQTFEEADDVLGFALTKICHEGSLAELFPVEVVLPALFTANVVAFRVYMLEVGIAPQFLAGHSLGEYSALCCSGAIRFADALRIVRERALLAKQIADQGDGAMTIVSNVDLATIEAACSAVSLEQRFVEVSCYNSQNEVAISGHLQAVQMVEDSVAAAGAQVTPLLGTAPFHCRLMGASAAALRKQLESYAYEPLRWPVVSNVTASVYEGPEQITECLTRQMMEPVRWTQTMDYLQREGVTLTIELGPRNVLSNLFRSQRGIRTLAFDHPNDREELFRTLGRQRVQGPKNESALLVAKCLRASIATPNTNLDLEQYQRGVVEPYRKLQAMRKVLEESGAEPSPEQLREALGLMQTILVTKGAPVDERSYWQHTILDQTGAQYLVELGGLQSGKPEVQPTS